MEKTVKKAKGGYIEAVGRRKTSTARVRITEAAKQTFSVNDKDAEKYFMTKDLYNTVVAPFEKSKLEVHFIITAKVSGGGIHSQAEAVRHGISRALLIFDTELHDNLKKSGFLKRDPRAKERRKFGLKKARKAPQWSKR
ncbi:MAG: 30S ribosomal protein S9 [Candidatus Paceibacterota bacterium]|jgi:small subunit ribosomal protein S9